MRGQGVLRQRGAPMYWKKESDSQLYRSCVPVQIGSAVRAAYGVFLVGASVAASGTGRPFAAFTVFLIGTTRTAA